MNYRREIDGLRALAVLPVILNHAGFKLFSGGFVGVDIFFVISGYLITSIIITDLQRSEFSLVGFYERRARRILPALFIVMAASSVAAYAWMLPDAFKNYGQSVFATSLFANNILLAMTSGYWALASEFKPLLHTWSLGVEEQYYIGFPLFLIVGWRYFRNNLVVYLGAITALILATAAWGMRENPDVTFFLPLTRAWEILLGSLVAFYLNKSGTSDSNEARRQGLSLLGFALIIASILAFDQHYPGLYTLLPVLGTVLIILFASERTIVGRLLSIRIMVGVGLISYSAYLWHQPLIAFARIYSVFPPSAMVMGALVVATLGLAFITWRFVEKPCRNRMQVSRKAIYSSSIVLTVLFAAFGYYLDKTYGMPSRIFDASVTKEEIDKRIYNERVYRFRTDDFSRDGRLKVLVLGNSFSRDFVNMTIETFDLTNTEIVYRNDLPECILPFTSKFAAELYRTADVVVFASGAYADTRCIKTNIELVRAHGKSIFYIGPKGFGYNLNWLMRVRREDLPDKFNPIPAEMMRSEEAISAAVPGENYISLLSAIVRGDQVPITDDMGRLLSLDGMHVTKFGARLIGEAAILHSPYGELLLQHKNPHFSNRAIPAAAISPWPLRGLRTPR